MEYDLESQIAEELLDAAEMAELGDDLDDEILALKIKRADA